MDGAIARSRTSASILIGVFATAWTAIIGIISVGFFVKLLGIESYALIGFFATMQTAISVLDLGLGSTVNREVARGVALNDLSRVNRAIHSLQLLYICVALLIGAAVFVAAPFIAKEWLGASSLNHNEVEWSIRLMGVIAAVRWPLGLYQGALIGLQRARISYQIAAVMATASNVGAIILIYFVDASLWTYFIWQVFVAIINLLWIRWSVWRELGTSRDDTVDAKLLRDLVKQSLTISGVAITGLLWAQQDKLIVSAVVSLADFGRYSLAVLIANALTIVLLPTFNVIYPRMTGFVAVEKFSELREFYRLGTKLLVCTLIPISASAFFYAYDLLYVWTGNMQLAKETAPIIGLLVIGAASNGILNFPYALQLATGNEKFAMYINILNVATAPIMVVLATNFGLWGGAIGWVIQAAIYFIANVAVTHRYILKGGAVRWLFADLAPGTVAAVFVVAVGHGIVTAATNSSFARLALAGLIALATAIAIAFIRKETRHQALQFYRGRAAE